MAVPRLAKANPVERAPRAYLWMDSLLTFGRIALSSFRVPPPQPPTILCRMSSVCPRAHVLNPFPLQCRRHSSPTLFVFLFVGGEEGEGGGEEAIGSTSSLSLIMHQSFPNSLIFIIITFIVIVLLVGILRDTMVIICDRLDRSFRILRSRSC